MDEGLGYAILTLLFLYLIPVAISFVVLYTITRNIKTSISGSVIGLIGAFIVRYVIPVWDGMGIIQNLFVFGLLMAFMGFIVIKIYRSPGKIQILSIVILTIIVAASLILLNTDRQEEIQAPEPIPLPPTEPAPGLTATGGYVYDDKLGYGFEYPDGWEFFINVDKNVEECDPTLNYETYTCVDFPDKNVKKVISFKKDFKKKFEGSEYESDVSVQIEFTVKSSTDLQEIKNEFKREVEMSGIPILNEAAISVNNINGYDMLSGTPDWKLRQVVFFANGMAHIFKYNSQDEFYLMYEETFNNAITSFDIDPDSQTLTSIASQ